MCDGDWKHVALIASTSVTDYEVSVEITPDVAAEVVDRVAKSCGELVVAIQDGRPDANLDLRAESLGLDEGEQEERYSPDSRRKELAEVGKEFVDRELIAPLSASKPIGGSPFFATVAKTRQEFEARGWERAVVVLVGDGMVVERAPRTGKMIRFGQEPVSAQTITEFSSLLGRLDGWCVMVAGFGADSKLPARRIRETERLLASGFEGAGASFVATRSPSLPDGCGASAGKMTEVR